MLVIQRRNTLFSATMQANASITRQQIKTSASATTVLPPVESKTVEILVCENNQILNISASC
jgi:hypothetical protein